MATDIDFKSSLHTTTQRPDLQPAARHQQRGHDRRLLRQRRGNGSLSNKGYTLNPPLRPGQLHQRELSWFRADPGHRHQQQRPDRRLLGRQQQANWYNNFGFVDHDGLFTNVVDPNSKGADGGLTFDQLLGVNDQAKAVGFWTDGNGNNHGFTYDVKSGSFNEVNIAGFASTTTTAINNEGHHRRLRCRTAVPDVSFIKEGNKIEWLTGPKGAVSLHGSRHQQRRSGCRVLHRREQADPWLPVRRALPDLQDHRRSEPAQCRRRRNGAQRHQRQGPGCRLLYG